MMTPQEALDRLKEGNLRFKPVELTRPNQTADRRDELITGQAPWAIVLSCADSRVVPEMAFDTGMGELFVIRVAGNVANTESTASIEYAVAHLGTPLIVVLGHQSCGAVTAAIQGGDNGPNLNALLGQITPAVKASESSMVDDVVKVNASLTAQRLIDDSVIIRDAVAAGNVRIVPAFYALDGGEVTFLENDEPAA